MGRHTKAFIANGSKAHRWPTATRLAGIEDEARTLEMEARTNAPRTGFRRQVVGYLVQLIWFSGSVNQFQINCNWGRPKMQTTQSISKLWY
jgi:hypothetical protein